MRWVLLAVVAFATAFAACGSDSAGSALPPVRASEFAPFSVPSSVTTTTSRREVPVARPDAADQTVTSTTTPPSSVSTIPWSSAELRDPQPIVRPIEISIPVLGIDAPIVALGVESETGLMDVPANVTEVGWYRYGPVPGAKGSAVLAAHVDMAGQGPGVFYDLDSLTVGDRFDLRFDDGSVTSFIVGDVERIAKTDLDVDEIFAPSGEAVLRLVTCGGGFNTTERSYEDNIVVTAQEVSA